jgi:N-acetylgalactosamine kinase
MDQAVAVLASGGSALRVDFSPLNAYTVQLPSNALFAVLHSGVTANKAANNLYNQRVVECRIAAQVNSKLKPSYKSLLDFVQKIGGLKLNELAENSPSERFARSVERVIGAVWTTCRFAVKNPAIYEGRDIGRAGHQ